MSDAEQLKRLFRQLLPLLERPSGLRSRSIAPQEVMVFPDPKCTYALLAWVQWRGSTIYALPPSNGGSTALPLRPLASAAGRQLLTVDKPPTAATHLLVMGWTRIPPDDPAFSLKLMKGGEDYALLLEEAEKHLLLRPHEVSTVHPEPALRQAQDDRNTGLRQAQSERNFGHLRAESESDRTPQEDVPSVDMLLLQAVLPQLKNLTHEERQVILIDLPAAQPARDTNRDLPPAPGGAPEVEKKTDLLSGSTHFIFASCQYPAGLLDHPCASASYRRMNTAEKDCSRAQALLLLGDQIYADATFGILDPSVEKDSLTRTYLDLLGSLEQYPSILTLKNREETRLYSSPDDHEIRDNWEPTEHEENERLKQLGLDAVARNGLTWRPGTPLAGIFWGKVDVGSGHEVFMLDTRTTRELRPWGPGTGTGNNKAHIVNEVQRKELEQWLMDRKKADHVGVVTPKFISSQVWLLPRHVGSYGKQQQTLNRNSSRIDSWDGYPESLCWLLGFIAENEIHGVVVLCGDAHLAGRTHVSLEWEKQHTELLILHTPALYAPFPFANAQPHHFWRQDKFEWKPETKPSDEQIKCEVTRRLDEHIRCEVTSHLQDLGNGFVRVEVTQTDTDGWRVTPVFDTEVPPPETLCAPWPCAPGNVPAAPLSPSHTG